MNSVRRKIEISPSNYSLILRKLRGEHSMHLSNYGVKFPGQDTAKEIWLVCLYSFLGKLMHKDDISTYACSRVPSLGKDQQIRHLAADGFFVLNRGEQIQNTNQKVSPGWHVLITMHSPKPNFLHKALKRIGRRGANNFEELKATYDFRCATCGSEEGRNHRYDSTKIVVLQQGHMDPCKALTLNNTIPQCQICNQTLQDGYVFNEKGLPRCVSSLSPVKRASQSVQNEIADWLISERMKL